MKGEAIARNLFEMSDMKVPILAIITGQGGSGGALALAVSNEVWMMENATYSILSPEGFASILWKDAKRASEAAKVMKMTAEDLYELGMIERIICEDEPATDDNIEGSDASSTAICVSSSSPARKRHRMRIAGSGMNVLEKSKK